MSITLQDHDLFRLNPVAHPLQDNGVKVWSFGTPGEFINVSTSYQPVSWYPQFQSQGLRSIPFPDPERTTFIGGFNLGVDLDAALTLMDWRFIVNGNIVYTGQFSTSAGYNVRHYLEFPIPIQPGDVFDAEGKTADGVTGNEVCFVPLIFTIREWK